MGVENTDKYNRARHAYKELFAALENMDGRINPVLHNALVLISKYLDLWKAKNKV